MTTKTMGEGRHLGSAVCALWLLGACQGWIVVSGGDGGTAATDLGGGSEKPACASVPAPRTADEEVLDEYPDGQRCVVPSCEELDPDQMGVLGGIHIIMEPGTWPAWYTLGKFGNGCESSKPLSCEPRRHGGHRGGHWRHNVCSNVYGPYLNDYYTLPPRGTVLGKDGDDAVVNGYCLDGIHFVRDGSGRIIGYVFWEVKTARYGISRLSGRPVCLFFRRKILASIFASILKEYPAVSQCGESYKYQLVLADADLWHALFELRKKAIELKEDQDKPDPGTAAIHLVSWTRPVMPGDINNNLAVSIESLLSRDLEIPQADLPEAKAIILEYLTGPPPLSVVEPYKSPACDNWIPGDPW